MLIRKLHSYGSLTGLGLGAILARASSVTDSMVEAASLGLANALTNDEIADDLIYPRIEHIRDISAHIATSVIQAAQREVCFHVVAIDVSLTVWIACGPLHRLERYDGSPTRCICQGEDVEPLSVVTTQATSV